MKEHEIVVSESQERMLAIVSPEKLDRVVEILEENDTPYAVFGKVTDDKMYTVLERGEVKASLPIDLLVDGFPEPERPIGLLPTRSPGVGWFTDPTDYPGTILRILESLNVCDRSWVFQQYDQHVQSNTVVDIGENAGVLEFPLGKKLAFTSDCNSGWCNLDPFHGTANSAAESLRNIVSMGARPIFIADCLNFGNPERPDSYAQFVESVKGLGQFSHDFDIPIVGGNVSLYNESEIDGSVHRVNPTPQIMMAGLFRDGFMPVRRNLITPWSNIFLVGETHSELNGTELQRVMLGSVKGLPPRYRPIEEKRSMDAILEAHSRNLIRSCNNIGRGGVAISLMKMTLNSPYGFKLDLEGTPGSARGLAEQLFSESSARYVAEVPESNQVEFQSIMEKHGVQICEIGLTITDNLANFGKFAISLSDARDAFRNGIPKYMEN
ncbi:MAG: AIR synthase-related protein [Candidatus Thorarchaeota archaeon]